MWDVVKAGSYSGAGTSCQAKLGHRIASAASSLNLRLARSTLVSAIVQPFGPSRRRSPLACIDQSSASAPGAKADCVSHVCKYLWGYLSETSTDSHWRVDWGPRTTVADFGSEGEPSTDNSNTNPCHYKVEVYPPTLRIDVPWTTRLVLWRDLAMLGFSSSGCLLDPSALRFSRNLENQTLMDGSW